jgi:glycyl-tRNA synthetase beta chain
MPEFLLELLSEDIPARMQVAAAEELKRQMLVWLAQAALTFDSAITHSTPRRLALVIYGLPDKSPDRTDERKGPKVGAPDSAIQGFLKSAGLDSIDQAEIRETGKGLAYFAVQSVSGKPASKVLQEAIYFSIPALSWPKTMRWGKGRLNWARPIKNVCAVFDGKPIKAVLDFDEFTQFRINDEVVGHRFLGPEAFTISNFADYERQLLDHHVVLDREKRKWRILGDAKRKAEEIGLRLVPDEALLEEVAGLVEWPVVLIGAIDDDFMTLPPEVRRTTMRANQKYFTLEYPDGKPAPRFVITANMVTADGGAAIVAGNERVLRARLSDARFFYDQDLKTKLADQRPKLAKIAFHAKLGTVLDRVERLEKLTVEIARSVPRAKPAMAIEAARLCKCDLVSGMVGEFPELQGVMGRYYALAQGAPDDVADAIRDHYKPLGPSDACPTAPVTVALALAEKIDTLVGFFAIGELPTGSKDPFALRRAALGVIRLTVENGLRLPLVGLFHSAVRLYGEQTSNLPNVVSLDQLLPFFADRLKVVLKERGVRHDLIDAVFALGGEDDLVRLLARVAALQSFLATDDGANLLTAYRRAANILKIEEKRDNASYDGPVDREFLIEPEEIALVQALDSAAERVDPLIDTEDFHGAMSVYSSLRPVVDAFFNDVTVNAPEPDIRANRLRLLSRIRGALNKIADFSRIA